ncbi:MAG: hypothetical protein WBQ89_16935, partial [Candidatus Acidiferrum sp.]
MSDWNAGTRQERVGSLSRIKITQQAAHGAFHFAIRQQGALGDRPIRVFSLHFHSGYMGYFVFVGAEYIAKAEAATLQDAVKNFRV